MSIMISIIRDELDRNVRAQAAYQRELSQYPEGSIVMKSRKSIRYFYLAYRNSLNQVKTDYIGNADNPKVKQLQQQIQKRREIVKILKDLELNERQIRKMLKRYGSIAER